MTLSQEDLLKVFVEEAMEHLSVIELDFLSLEKSKEWFDPDLINRVFRAAHSIKGGAGFIGLNNIKNLSHKMETVLGRFRKEKQVPGAETVDVLLLATDFLKNLVANVQASDSMDITGPMAALAAVMESEVLPVSRSLSRPGKNAVSGLETLPVTLADLSVSESLALQARDEGKNIYILKLAPEAGGPPDGRSIDAVMDEVKAYTTFLGSAAFSPHKTGPVEGNSARPDAVFVAFACVLNAGDASLLLEVDPENLFQVDPLPAPFPENDDKGLLPPEAFSEKGPASVQMETAAAFEDPLDAPRPAAPNGSGKHGDCPESNGTRAEDDSSPELLPASIRVNIPLLDSLMNMAGELVLSRNQLLKAISAGDRQKTEIVGKRLDHVTTELQKIIMLTRMQPVGHLFNRFPRIVRNISRELGKETELVIEGAEVELDRTLMEAMSDPLNHLIRNAVDHGIETAEVRKHCGKHGTGRIGLRAFNEAGQVVIEVSDDGAGIDPETVSAAAVLKGFVTEDQVRIMGPKDKLNLIFLPGFSTASNISDLSGRGVGMDVVKTNLDRLGGLIDLASAPGGGTRVQIRLPLTLAIIPCQIVSVEGERFAVPQMNLEELLRIRAGDIKDRVERVGDAAVVRLRGHLLPLIRLADVLRMNRTFTDAKTHCRVPDRRRAIADRRSRKSPPAPDAGGRPPDGVLPERDDADGGSHPPEPPSAWTGRRAGDRRQSARSALNIAVVTTGQIRYGLIVEAFHDSEEIVVKPLGRHLKACRAYAGATIMGDGKVALILDVNNLSLMAGLLSVSGSRRGGEVARMAQDPFQPAVDPIHLLVFRNACSEQFALPMSQVNRVLKIGKDEIQTFGKTRVILYRGGNLPVFSLDELADVSPLDNRDRLLVIVFTAAGREMGLLGTGPVDSVMTGAGIDGSTLKQPGIMGSVVLEGVPTLIVDVLDFTRRLRPEWFPEAPSAEREMLKTRTVLVADDSGFFRNQIKAFIQNEGYHVLDAEDGEAAWQILQQSGEKITLVVTDMEMPRMNGFELTRAIRNDPRFCGIPVIALTTLARDKDKKRAISAGVDEYQIKLDREKLLDCMRSLIGGRMERVEPIGR